MTKRFKYYEEPNGEFPFPYIKNTDGKSIISLYECCDLLNALNDENEQLKTQLQNTSDQRDEFHRGARENANRVGKLKKENEQLWKDVARYRGNFREMEDVKCELAEENKQLKQLLDYADDLIQSHLSEHFIRQWRNFKTGHKEYNDFWEEKLKTHKKLKEDVE